MPLDHALLQAASMEEKDRNESAQNILEEHCSRVWDNSAEITPSRSPGRLSPRIRSPDRHRRGQPGSLALFSKPHHKHDKRKDKEYSSASAHSFDSGMGDDRGVYDAESRHRHIHHHHHHHHTDRDVPRRYHDSMSKSFDTAFSGKWDDSNRGRSREGSKRTVGHTKKSSDSSSVIDSGVSLPYDRPQNSVPNSQNPNSEK